MIGKSELYDIMKKDIRGESSGILLPLCNEEAKPCKRELENISRAGFTSIINAINRYYEYKLLIGDSVKLGYGLGTLIIKNVKVRPSTTRINWGESNKQKAFLISKGLTPYCRKDALIAKEKGIRYEGVPWFIYNNEPYIPYVKWYPSNDPHYKYIGMNVSRNNNTDKLIKEYKKYSEQHIINNTDLGISHKIKILLSINPKIINRFYR